MDGVESGSVRGVDRQLTGAAQDGEWRKLKLEKSECENENASILLQNLLRFHLPTRDG